MELFIIFIFILAISFLILSHFRNNWVYDQRIKYNHKISIYLKYLIKNELWEEYHRISYIDFYDIIGSYNNMYLKFWIWDLSKFVNKKDTTLFNKINSFKESE